MLDVAAQYNLLVHQLDVKSTFLNGTIDEEIYVAQPEGFKALGEEAKVYHIQKALYGLKQAPRAWNQRIDSYLTSNGYQKSKKQSIPLQRFDSANFMILCLYVDDLIFIGLSQNLIENFKLIMKQKYEMSDLGLMKFFLDFQKHQEPGQIFIQIRNLYRQVIK